MTHSGSQPGSSPYKRVYGILSRTCRASTPIAYVSTHWKAIVVFSPHLECQTVCINLAIFVWFALRPSGYGNTWREGAAFLHSLQSGKTCTLFCYEACIFHRNVSIDYFVFDCTNLKAVTLSLHGTRGSGHELFGVLWRQCSHFLLLLFCCSPASGALCCVWIEFNLI